MIRGTTANFIFNLPHDMEIEDIISITVTVWQKGNSGTKLAPLPITKTYTRDSIDKDNHRIVVTLLPEETARFTDKLKARIQLKIDSAGAVYATYQHAFSVYPMSDDMVGGDMGGGATSEDGWVIFDGQEITATSREVGGS